MLFRSGFLEASQIGKECLGYTYGIKVQAKPDQQEKDAMKQAVYQSFANMATPEQGGTWVSDALHFQEMVDNGVDMELIRLLMTAKQKANLKEVQQMKERAIQLQTQGNQQNLMAASQAKIQEEQQLSQMRMQEKTHDTNEQIRLSAYQSQFRTENQTVVNQQKAEHKQIETLLKTSLGK